MDLRTIAAVIVTVCFFAFQMYIALVKQFAPMLQSPVHLIFALTLVFIYYPADHNYREKIKKAAKDAGTIPEPALLNKHSWWNWIDLLAFAGIGYLLWYILTQFPRLNDYVLGVDEVLTIDHATMIVAILVLLVAV